jgi:hypothetical protein
MKKIILTLLVVLISSSAAAEWTRVGGGGDGSDVFVDLETLRKNGSKVKLWSLRNFKTLNGETKVKHLSNKTQWEMDCKEEQIRMPAYMEFAQRGGVDETIASQFLPDDNWTPIVPKSVAQMIFEVGCDTTIGTNKWTLLEPSDAFAKNNPNHRVYFDYSSIQRNGDRVTMWKMVDRRSGTDRDPISESYSVKFHREYDCIEQKVRSISSIGYSTNMGVGKSGKANNNRKPWLPAERTADEIWKMACDSTKQ